MYISSSFPSTIAMISLRGFPLWSFSPLLYLSRKDVEGVAVAETSAMCVRFVLPHLGHFLTSRIKDFPQSEHFVDNRITRF